MQNYQLPGIRVIAFFTFLSCALFPALGLGVWVWDRTQRLQVESQAGLLIKGALTAARFVGNNPAALRAEGFSKELTTVPGLAASFFMVDPSGKVVFPKGIPNQVQGAQKIHAIYRNPFVLGGQVGFAALTGIETSAGWWTVGMFSRDADFLASIRAKQKKALISVALMSCLGFVMAWFFSQLLAKPLEALAAGNRHADRLPFAYREIDRILRRIEGDRFEFPVGNLASRGRGSRGGVKGVSIVQSSVIPTKQANLIEEPLGKVHQEIDHPLSVIHSGAAQMKHLAENGSIGLDRIVSVSTRIEGAAQKIDKIFKAYRTMSCDASGDPVEIISVDHLLDESFDLCRLRYSYPNIELRLPSRGTSNLFIEGKPRQLCQAFLNLLGRSYESARQTAQGQRWIQVGIRGIGEKVEFRIWDSGMGARVDQYQGPAQVIPSEVIGKHGGALEIEKSGSQSQLVILFPRYRVTLRASA